MFGVLNRSADSFLTPWLTAVGHVYVGWKLKRNDHPNVRIFQGNNTKENTIRKKIRSKETHQPWRPCHSLTKRVFNTGAFQETQTTIHDETKHSNSFISLLREVLVSTMVHRYYWRGVVGLRVEWFSLCLDPGLFYPPHYQLLWLKYFYFSGTRAYMPPEFLRSGWYDGCQSTVWALGMSLVAWF